MRHPVRGSQLVRGAWLFALVLLFLDGPACAASPSTLDTHGPDADQTAFLWWVMIAIAVVVFIVVLAFLMLGLFRRARGTLADPPDAGRADPRGGVLLILVGGVIVPLVALILVMTLTVRTMVALSAPLGPSPLAIEVVGHQYWWSVTYPDSGLVTANEIHVPVGQAVELRVTSDDVIHSFWVPQLMGKIDLIPGQVNTRPLRADQPGDYRGQCAEFCGLQHAHMAFLVVAEPRDQFDAWLQAQLQPAGEPSASPSPAGAQAFARAGCIQCHAIRYAQQPTGGKIGPDLTHVGSRSTIAAGTLANNVGTLAAWIANPQEIKPGNQMPNLGLDPATARAIAEYLTGLK